MLGYEAVHTEGEAVGMPSGAASFSLSSHQQQQQYAAYLQHAQFQQAAAHHSLNLQLLQQLHLDPSVIHRLQQQHQHQQQQHAAQPPSALHHSALPSTHVPSSLKLDSTLPLPFPPLSQPSSSPSPPSVDLSPSSGRLPPMLLLSKTQQTLAHHLNTRRTPAELAGKGILYDTGKKGQASARVQQRQKELRRQMEKDRLSAFIANRPSLDELVRSNNRLVEDTMTWTRQTMHGQTPTPRNCHSMAHIRPAAASSSLLGQLCLLGGYGTGQQSSELLCLSLDDPLGPMWSRPAVAGPVPCERYSHTMNAVGGKLILFGGLSANGSGTWLNDLHILDTDTSSPSAQPYNTTNQTASSPTYPSGVLSWYQPACHGSPPPCPRAAHTAAVLGSTLFIFAGNDGKQLFNDLHCLHLPTFTWSAPQQHGHIPSPRAGHTMNVLPGEQLIVFGGGNANGPINDLHILDSHSMTWTRPSVYGTPPSPRAGHTACTVFGAELLVFGGGYLNKVFNDLHLFNSDTGVWSRPSDTGTVPIPRAGHTSNVIGSRIYTFAGGDAEDVFNDLHLLDTSFFRMTELMAEGGYRADGAVGMQHEVEHGDGADSKRTAVLISHSMSAPTSPSSRIRHVSEVDSRERSTDEAGLLARLEECQSDMSTLLAAAVRELDIRQREREEEENEVMRLMAATRHRRLVEHRSAMDEMQRMQLVLATHITDMRDAIKQHIQRQQRQRLATQPPDALRDLNTHTEVDDTEAATTIAHTANEATETASPTPTSLSSMSSSSTASSASSSSSASPPSRSSPSSSTSSSTASARRKSPRKDQSAR